MKVWVIDTSSLINLRQVPHTDRDRVLGKLDEMVDQGVLFYTPQVVAELVRYLGPGVALEWAKRNAPKATRYGPLYDEARLVLQRLPNLIDHSKSGEDQADPYVVALAQRLETEGHRPTVITDDVNTKPNRTSLAAAAGVFEFPSLPMTLFLSTQNIWPHL